ncbi:MAG: restriction endonuclease subunit S [Chitinispirillaceae bacterium]|nr:restriction endonuclease subunit S [Chitinispirillaceae bacterium]
MKRLKHVVYLKSGDGITAEEIEPEGKYPVYGGNGLRGYTNKYSHTGHYVLIGRQGALCGNIKYANDKFWASEHAVVATPCKPAATIWLGELLRIMELFLPVPPLPEQRSISAFLDRETAKLDTLISKVEAVILKLKEYRTALISAAVTGKIDVSTSLNAGVREAA